jgi:hypothetical protein
MSSAGLDSLSTQDHRQNAEATEDDGFLTSRFCSTVISVFFVVKLLGETISGFTRGAA